MLSCNDEKIETSIQKTTEFKKSLEFIILEDEAQEFATNFLNKTSKKSRSASNSQVKTIWRNIELNQGKLRSSDNKVNIPIYVVTYTDTDNNPDGYVVTVGDKRVMNRTLVFSDKGHWNLTDMPVFKDLFWNAVDNSLTKTLSESETDPCDTYEYEENYSVQKFVAEMLLEWDQAEEPYNDSIPIRIHLPNQILNLAAGCVPIAMAQIMAYNEHPSSGYYIHEQYNHAVYPTYNWKKIKAYGDATLLDNEGKSGVANLIAEIGHRANTIYGITSPTISTSIKPTFTEMGYTSTDVTWFNLQTILNNITENKAVYIHGNSNETAHAWIIEGYRKDICDIVYVRDCPYGGESIPPTVIGQTVSNYLYFNLGYGGESNGFYLSDNFNTWEYNEDIAIVHDIQPQD